jgi:hypothetical protein
MKQVARPLSAPVHNHCWGDVKAGPWPTLSAPAAGARKNCHGARGLRAGRRYSLSPKKGDGHRAGMKSERVARPRMHTPGWGAGEGRADLDSTTPEGRCKKKKPGAVTM